jgi:DNA-binding NtrC family response regulator
MKRYGPLRLAPEEPVVSQSVLVIEQDAGFREELVRLLEEQGLDVEAADDCDAALRSAAENLPGLVLCNDEVQGMSGLGLAQRLRRQSPGSVLVMLTEDGTADSAVAAMRNGASDFISKRVGSEELRARVEKCLDISHPGRRPGPGPKPSPIAGILGESPAMKALLRDIDAAAGTATTTVLVLGETGVGKELVSRAVHTLSVRGNGPFVAANCTAIPAGLAETELFGHERGAFTGADRRHRGLFEVADGGTLLLDEVGDLAPAIQAKLLRVLDERCLRRVGGTRPVPVDVRLIAATNRPIEEMTQKGTFRADLYYRLNQFPLRVPPLRERGDDVLLLARHYVRSIAQQLGKAVTGFTPEVEAALRVHRFPGNVRELRNLVEQAVIRSSGPLLGLDLFPGLPVPLSSSVSTLSTGSPLLADLRRQVRVEERVRVMEALRVTGGNQNRAAEMLGISRYALRRKMMSFGRDDDTMP